MTNPSHHPDLERCKKLTELGFPKTELYFLYNAHIRPEEIVNYKAMRLLSAYNKVAVCPSVMEMMDVIPRTIIDNRILLNIDSYEDNIRYRVGYAFGCDARGIPRYFRDVFIESLPNALADLIVWLVENGHLTFDKR